MGRIVNLGIEETIKIPNATNYKFICDTVAKPSLVEILNISGSGFLQSAYNWNQSSAYFSQIVITIDGIVFLNLNNTAIELSTGQLQGIINGESTISTGSTAIAGFPLASPSSALNPGPSINESCNYEFNSETEQSPGANGCLFMLSEQLRFENSLVISVKKENGNVKTIIEYYLD